MTRILLTGSEGFIGKHLKQYILKSLPDVEIISVDKKNGHDLKNQDYVRSLPDVDFVVHLAAYNGTKNFYEYPLDVIDDNVLPTHYLIKRYLGKIRKFIFTSTCEVYAGAVDFFEYPVPTDESVPLVISDVKNPRWSYAASKIINEASLFALLKQHNQDILILRYHNIYGPGQTEHFISDYIDRALKNEFILYGYKNTRSFMFIDDAVEITTELIFSDFKNAIINVGVDEEISVLRVAKIINRILKFNSKIELRESPTGSVNRRSPNLNLLNSVISKKKYISLEEGLKLTIDSILKKGVK